MSKPKKLTPSDLERCQAEWLGGSFMTLGPRQMERCTKKPDWVATEKRAGKDGQRGSMSLCEEHRLVFIEKHPGLATLKKIHRAKIMTKSKSKWWTIVGYWVETSDVSNFWIQAPNWKTAFDKAAVKAGEISSDEIVFVAAFPGKHKDHMDLTELGGDCAAYREGKRLS